MPTATQAYDGPAILSGGYRVFFFSAAVWAVFSLLIWVLFLAGVAEPVFGPLDIDMVQWHGHTLIYGYGGAVVAGFSLAAIPNWTGRPPVCGAALLTLFIPWLIARGAEVGLLLGGSLEAVRAGAELLFFALFIGIALREIIAGKNWRNLKIIVVFSLFFFGALVTNLERLDVIALSFSGWGFGLGVLLVLITLIGGRIIPAFTANWMRQQGLKSVPTMFNRFDAVVVLVTVLTMGVMVARIYDGILGSLALVGAGLHVVRLWRWRGWHTVTSPIVAILHISYLWVPVGFLLVGLSALGVGDIDMVSALHAWTVGGVGSTTLAVMTRATLGHSGLPLKDSGLLTTLYVAINLAGVARVFGVLVAGHSSLLMTLAGLLWCAAFVVFLVRFGPLHWRR
ncbi:MAG: NnrS family protein [Kordiimonadaceae bacterium]|nr:NnrS family protein [Kordiimonadaceae bacterium]